jgi:hypothetical protein
LRELAGIWHGNLVFFFVVVEAALVGLGAMLFIGGRFEWASVAKLPRTGVSVGLNAWWVFPLTVMGLVVGVIVGRDLLRAAMRLLGASRAAAIVAGGALAGALLSMGYYPALAAQLSPKEVFDTFRELRRPDDQLALLGTSPRAGAFYAEAAVPVFADVATAFAWIDAEPAPRRFLVAKARDLPRLNSLYRGAHGRNMPVLDARSSQNVLVSSSLSQGEVDQNPFAQFVLDEAPAIARPVSARFHDQIELLGWDVIDARGKLVSFVVPQTAYTIRFYYRVLEKIPTTWRAFLHIDGQQRRYNGDHAVLGGEYAMNLWQKGDIVRDDHALTLEANFTPGPYWVFVGFFNQSARMPVTDGQSQEDRVVAGTLLVK